MEKTLAVEGETMTLKEADDALKTCERQLADAQAALDTYERNVGQHALDVGIDNATQETLRLQIAVKAAQTAVAAAQQQREDARRREQAARVVQLRAEADKLDTQADAHAAFVNEWGPKVQQAREQLGYAATRALRLRDQAADIERRLQSQ